MTPQRNQRNHRLCATGALLLTVFLAACPPTQPGTPTPVSPVVTSIETIAKTCGEPALVKLVVQILPQVVMALLSEQWSQLLDGLVATLKGQGVTDALTAVTCAVVNIQVNPPPASFADGIAGKGDAVATLKLHASQWATIHPLQTSASPTDAGTAGDVR